MASSHDQMVLASQIYFLWCIYHALRNAGIITLPSEGLEVGLIKKTLFHYDVMGEKVGTKWRKYMKTCMFYT